MSIMGLHGFTIIFQGCFDHIIIFDRTSCDVAPGIAFKVPDAPAGFRPAVALRRAAEVRLYLGRDRGNSPLMCGFD